MPPDSAFTYRLIKYRSKWSVNLRKVAGSRWPKALSNLTVGNDGSSREWGWSNIQTEEVMHVLCGDYNDRTNQRAHDYARYRDRSV